MDASALEQAVETLQQRLEQVQTVLAQQQKLATLGMITAVIAHEFNNILTPMISYTRYALSEKSDATLKEKALAKALAGAERAAAISQSLLGFTRPDASTVANVKKAVQETLSCLSRDLSKDAITLCLDIDENAWVAMNAGQLQQVLMNLIVNARAAMLEGRRGGRKLTVTGKTVKRGKIIEIALSDTGKGIDPQVLPHIFEPFFSTTPPPHRPHRRPGRPRPRRHRPGPDHLPGTHHQRRRHHDRHLRSGPRHHLHPRTTRRHRPQRNSNQVGPPLAALLLDVVVPMPNMSLDYPLAGVGMSPRGENTL